ncbi:hypothetical protein BD309DRAFT_722475 [Dichomitus squalens]|nr:hypothetical protein BD309DRAFT_722475 [Dichomitus squalens]
MDYWNTDAMEALYALAPAREERPNVMVEWDFFGTIQKQEITYTRPLLGPTNSKFFMRSVRIVKPAPRADVSYTAYKFAYYTPSIGSHHFHPKLNWPDWSRLCTHAYGSKGGGPGKPCPSLMFTRICIGTNTQIRKAVPCVVDKRAARRSSSCVRFPASTRAM